MKETWRSLNQSVPGSTETRNKRGISDRLTNGGVGLSAGYKLWSTNRLKKHVKEVEEDFWWTFGWNLRPEILES